MPSSNDVSVFAVDDHPEFLRAIEVIIDATDGFTLVGTADCGEHALASLATHVDLDLVLMDLQLPDADGVATARRYAAAGGEATIVLMSTKHRDDLPHDTFESSIAAFLPKSELSTDALIDLWDDVPHRLR